MIAYASVYGNTENAANVLACRLAEKGVKVKMFDASVTPASYIVSDAFKYNHLVFAATTQYGHFRHHGAAAAGHRRPPAGGAAVRSSRMARGRR